MTRNILLYYALVTDIGYQNSMEKNIQVQILKFLEVSPSGLQIEEIAEKPGLTRHTVAKYLEILRIEYLKETAVYHLRQDDPLLNLGAEIDGKLVGNLISYFRSLGFDILNMIPLERELKK